MCIHVLVVDTVSFGAHTRGKEEQIGAQLIL